MSTLSSSLNGAATLTLVDYYTHAILPEGGGGRGVHAGPPPEHHRVGHVRTTMAIAMIHVKTALDPWWSFAAIFSGGMLGLFLLGFFSRSAGTRAAQAGVASGILVIVWMTALPALGGLAGRLAQPLPRLPHHRLRHRSRAGRRPRRPLGAVGRIAQDSPAMTDILRPSASFGRGPAPPCCAPSPWPRQHATPAPGIRPSCLAETLNDSAPYPQCHASTIAEADTGPSGRRVVRRHARERARCRHLGDEVRVRALVGTRRGGDRRAARWHAAPDVEPRALPAEELRDRRPAYNSTTRSAPAHAPGGAWSIASDDGGRTWSAAARLPSPLLGPIKNKPVLLADGAWLSPSSTEDSPTGWRAHVERSENAGRTWAFIGPIVKGPLNLEAIQGSILFHPGGLLQMVGRTRSGVVFEHVVSRRRPHVEPARGARACPIPTRVPTRSPCRTAAT